MKGTLTHIDGKWAVYTHSKELILIQPSMVKYYFLDSEDVGNEVEFDLTPSSPDASLTQFAILKPYNHG